MIVFLRPVYGRLAQLVEHLVYTERVIGSSPIASTIEILLFEKPREVTSGAFLYLSDGGCGPFSHC